MNNKPQSRAGVLAGVFATALCLGMGYYVGQYQRTEKYPEEAQIAVTRQIIEECDKIGGTVAMGMVVGDRTSNVAALCLLTKKGGI